MAVLVGPDAPAVINMATRASYASDVWDFFKPDMSSEYPQVRALYRVGCAVPRCSSEVAGSVAAYDAPCLKCTRLPQDVMRLA